MDRSFGNPYPHSPEQVFVPYPVVPKKNPGQHNKDQDEGQRLGRKGSDEIKNHEFFRGIDFNCDLRKKEAPHKPKIKFAEDTSNFDPIDEGKLRPDEDIINEEDNNGYHGFYEFTFRRFFDDAGHPVFSPGPNAKRSMAMRPIDIDDNENPSGPVYV